jgi:hypothetical protein
MEILINMIDGKRVLNIKLFDLELIAFDHLLNRALNTMPPDSAGPWLELEARIDQFIKEQNVCK